MTEPMSNEQKLREELERAANALASADCHCPIGKHDSFCFYNNMATAAYEVLASTEPTAAQKERDHE